MNQYFKLVLLLLTLTILLAGCKNTDELEAEANKNIVRVNSNTYTTQDLWDFANVMLWEMEPKDLSNTEVKDKILEDFIEQKLLVEEAERRGISVEQNNQFNQLYIELSTSQGAKELRAVTGHYDIDARKIAELAEERLMADELLQEVTTNTPIVSEDDLKKYYESKNTAESPIGEAHVYHIFTTDNDTIQKAAEELSSGIIFAEVARKYSESPEKSRGGDLGFIKENQYPDFFSEAFKLKEGETSAVYQSEYGYHIFKMIQYAKASRYSYEDMKQTLLAELYIEKRQELIGEFINALISNADIDYLNDFTLDELFPRNIAR